MGILDGVKGAAGSAKSVWDSDRAKSIRSGIAKAGGGIKTGAQNISVNIKPAAQKVWSGAQIMGGGIQKAGGGAKTLAAGGAGLMGGLALGALNKGKKHSGNLILILSVALFLFDRTVGYRGFYITGIGSIIGILKLFTSVLYVVGIWVIFYFFMSKDRSPKALFTFIFAMAAVVITIAIAFSLDRLAMLHIGFILLLWFTFIKNREDAPQANLFLIGLLIMDLYIYSIVMHFAPQFAQYVSGFPILFFLTLGYVYQETNSKLAWLLIFGVVLYYLILLGPALAQNLDLAGIRGVETRIPSWKEFIDNFRKKNIDEPIAKVNSGIEAWLKKQVEYATTGKIEEVKEPLGVYLINVKPADKRYYEDEDVVVWGTARARTLDDPINIQVGCFVDKFNETQNKMIRIRANNVDPQDKFSVFTSEEQDFACKFDKCCDPEKPQGCAKVRSNCTFKAGANTVTAFADFNFETLAQLKVYFIDKERERAMARENQDPFVEFKIKDKKPVASYTSGPAEIGMGTATPLIGVSEGYIAYPSIDFSLNNREGWQGRINSIRELVLFLPAGIELAGDTENGVEPCNKVFNSYSPDDCEASCDTFVLDECNKICSTGYCGYDCNEINLKCKNTCASLFDEGGQTYNAYALNMTNLRAIDEMKDFDKFKSFRCRLKPSPSVLGNSPITTKFFRVKARYNYTVLSPVTVNVDKIPEAMSGGTIKYTGSNGIVKKIYEVAGDDDLGGVMAVGAYLESGWDPNKVNNGLCGGPCGTICGYTKEGKPIMKEYSCGLFQFNICGGMGTRREPCMFTDEAQQCQCWIQNYEAQAELIKPRYATAMAASPYTQYSDEWYCYIWSEAEVNEAKGNCMPYLSRVNSAVAMLKGSGSETIA